MRTFLILAIVGVGAYAAYRWYAWEEFKKHPTVRNQYGGAPFPIAPGASQGTGPCLPGTTLVHGFFKDECV